MSKASDLAAEQYLQNRRNNVVTQPPTRAFDTSDMSEAERVGSKLLKYQGREFADTIITGLPDDGYVAITPSGQFTGYSEGASETGTDRLSRMVQQTYGTTDPMQIQQMIQSGGKRPFGQFVKSQEQMRDPESVGDIQVQAPNLAEQQMSKMYQEGLEEFGTGKLAYLKAIQSIPFFGEGLDEAINSTFLNNEGKLEKFNNLMKRYEEQYPGASTSAELVGTVAGVVLGGKYLEKLGGLKGANKVLNKFKDWYNKQSPLTQKGTEVTAMTTAVATEQGITGYLEGVTDEERKSNAFDRAVTSTITTVPISLAFPILRPIFQDNKTASKQLEEIADEFGVSISTADFIKRAFDSGLSLEDMLTKIRQSGDKRMIAEANQDFETIVEAASQNFGKSSEIVKNEVNKRTEGQVNELRDITNKFFGLKPEGKQTILGNIQKEFGDTAKNLYEEAYDIGIDLSSPYGLTIMNSLSNMPKDMFDNIVSSANKLAIAQGLTKNRPFNPIRTRTTEDGRLQILDEPNLFQLDRIKRRLDKVVDEGTDAIDGKVKTEEGEIALAILKDLRPALKNANPKYKKALAISQGKIKTEEALRFGEKFFDKRKDDLIEILNGASASEISALRQAVRNQIDFLLDKAKNPAQVKTDDEVRAVMSILPTLRTRATRDKLELLLGKKNASEYGRKIDEMKKSYELMGTVKAGSPTKKRTAFEEEVKESAERGFFGQIGDADPVKATKQLKKFIAGDPEAQMRARMDEIYEELAGFVTQRQGKDADAALQYLQTIRDGGKLGKAQQNYLFRFLSPLVSPSASFITSTITSDQLAP